MKKFPLIVIALIVVVLGVGYFGQGALRGLLLSGTQIDNAMKVRADINADGVLTAREIRASLVDVLRGVALHRSGYDIDGDGVINRADLTAAKQSLRRLLMAICGNGIVEAGEQCDDHNTVSGDGCSALCAVETVSPPASSAASSVGMSVPASSVSAQQCNVHTYALGEVLYQDTSTDTNSLLKKPNSLWTLVEREGDTLILNGGGKVIHLDFNGQVRTSDTFRMGNTSRLPTAANDPIDGEAPGLVTKQFEEMLGVDYARDEFYVFSSAISSYQNGALQHFTASIFRLNYKTFELIAEYPVPETTPYPIVERYAYDAENHVIVALVRPMTQWSYTAVPGQQTTLPPPPVEHGTYIVTLPVANDPAVPIAFGPWQRIGPTTNTSFTYIALDAANQRAFVTTMDTTAPYTKHLHRFSYQDGSVVLQQTRELTQSPQSLWWAIGKLFIGASRWNPDSLTEEAVAEAGYTAGFGPGTILSDPAIVVGFYIDVTPAHYLRTTDLERMKSTFGPGIARDWSDNVIELPYQVAKTKNAAGVEELLVLSYTDRKAPSHYNGETLNTAAPTTPRLIIRRLNSQCP